MYFMAIVFSFDLRICREREKLEQIHGWNWYSVKVLRISNTSLMNKNIYHKILWAQLIKFVIGWCFFFHYLQWWWSRSGRIIGKPHSCRFRSSLGKYFIFFCISFGIESSPNLVRCDEHRKMSLFAVGCRRAKARTQVFFLNLLNKMHK